MVQLELRICEECSRVIVGKIRRGRCENCYRSLLWKLNEPKRKQAAAERGETWTGRSQRSPTEVLLDKVAMGPRGCWLFTGRLYRKGYGAVWIPGRGNMQAHRASYEFFRGPIPDGLQIDHLCHTNDKSCLGGDTCLHRRCINPNHLEPVTGGVNTRRGLSNCGINSRKTHCKRGHEFTPENTYRTDTGRSCRECLRAIWRERYRRRAQSSAKS